VDSEQFQKFIDDAMKALPAETRMVNKVYESLKKAGKPIVKVWDTEEWTQVSTLRELQEIVFNLDECFLYTADNSWVRIVLGNEWDCVVDYTVDLEEALEPVNSLYDKNA
jgi:hypothetical protein